MSAKGKGRHADDARRVARRQAQLASLQQRAATDNATRPRREHIAPVDIEGNEQRYEGLLLAIESGLVEAYRERRELPIDDEAERALRLLIARFEGDAERRSGSPDVDAMADRVNHNIDLYFRRNALLSRAEIIGAIRRVIGSIATHHDAANPRAYFEFVGDFIFDVAGTGAAEQAPPRTDSGIWLPGQSPREDVPEETPSRPGGLWLPGDG